MTTTMKVNGQPVALKTGTTERQAIDLAVTGFVPNPQVSEIEIWTDGNRTRLDADRLRRGLRPRG